MQVFSREQVTGNVVNLKTSLPKHIADKDIALRGDDPVEPFAKVFLNAVDQVSSLQNDANNLEQQFLLSPDDVNVHEVMIASEKARLSLTMFKTIADKAIRAYNEIMMIR